MLISRRLLVVVVCAVRAARPRERGIHCATLRTMQRDEKSMRRRTAKAMLPYRHRSASYALLSGSEQERAGGNERTRAGRDSRDE